MKPRAMDSLDTIEMAMAIVDVFEVTVLAVEAGAFDIPRGIVDWLEIQLSNQRPNKAARAS